MRRESRELELFPDQWAQLESIKTVLDHDEMEETLRVLIELGVKAISVTNKENRSVRLLGGERRPVGEKCKTCGQQSYAFESEISVRLALDAGLKKDVRPEEED